MRIYERKNILERNINYSNRMVEIFYKKLLYLVKMQLLLI